MYMCFVTKCKVMKNRGISYKEMRYFENVCALAGRKKKKRAASCFDSACHRFSAFGETGFSAYLCNSEKRKSLGFSSFRVLGANYPI